MGRTSKFSFPLPGRKTSSTTKEKEKPPELSSSNVGYRSKAQRFFGTDNELNIDLPSRSDDHSWGYPSSSRSSGMSISISESTRSTRSKNEKESFAGSNADRWEHESGVFPQAQRLRGKASSVLLGKHFGEDEGTDNSSLPRRMRHEGSDSTLKSYYDRQKSPLSISQQTSASSARDLALRKGFPPVIPRSPLLQIDSVDPYNWHFAEHNNEGTYSREKSAKVKPARLDFSTIFSRSKKTNSDPAAMSPASISTNASLNRAPSSGPRKLKKAQSRESLQSHKLSMRSTHSRIPLERQGSTSDTLYGLYDNYEQSPVRSPVMGRIPESSVPERETRSKRENDRDYKSSHAESRPAKPISIRIRESSSEGKQSTTRDTHLSPSNGQTFSWKHLRSNVTNLPWENSSAASVSSHNTKTSRHTSTSVFSNQDLKQSSVLSLSSDSEGEASDSEPFRTSETSYDDRASERQDTQRGLPQRAAEDRRQRPEQPEATEPRRRGSRKGAAQTSPFITILDGSLPSTRISGPW